MKPCVRLFSTGLIFLALAGASAAEPVPAPASSQWFTLLGDPDKPEADYIQFDPGALAFNEGVPTIPVRVSRAHPRTSREGIVFRSFEAVVAVDCKAASARFLRSSFYAAPGFKGGAFRTVVFEPADVRPMAFREIQGEPARRVVRAACNTAVQSIESSPR